MGDSWVQVKIRKSDKEQLLTTCKDEFLRHHPEYDGSRITQGFIIRQLIKYYLTT